MKSNKYSIVNEYNYKNIQKDVQDEVFKVWTLFIAIQILTMLGCVATGFYYPVAIMMLPAEIIFEYLILLIFESGVFKKQ